VEDYDEAPNPEPFVRPQTYIRYKDMTDEEVLQCISYDLDPEDEKFLRQLNAAKKILSENKFELIMDRCEKEAFRMQGKIPPIPAVEKVLPELKPNIIQVVYNYWMKKRERNSGTPLIADLIEPPDPEDPNPYKPFRRRTEEFKQSNRRTRKNDLPSLMRMKQLRHEMEKSRTLLEMIKKREKMKKDKIEVMNEIFELQIIQIRELEQQEGPFIPTPKRKIKHIPSSPIGGTYERTPPQSEMLNMIKKSTPKKLRIEKKMDPYEFEEKDGSESEDEDASAYSSEYSPSEDSPPTSPKPTLSKLDMTEEEVAKARLSGDKPPENGFISHIPKTPPFRGRARMGRGGRIIFDRTLNRTNGIVQWWESDQESNERLNSLVDLHRSGFHPLMCGRTDADKLLKKLLQQQQGEQLQQKKRKRE